MQTHAKRPAAEADLATAIEALAEQLSEREHVPDDQAVAVPIGVLRRAVAALERGQERRHG